MIRTILAATALACSVWAAAQSPRFEDAVGYELSQLLRGSDVGLSAGVPAFNPTFYSQDFNRPEEVRCERAAAFGLIARASQSGTVLVAVCEAEADRVRGLARDAKRGLEVVMKALRSSGARIDEAAARSQWAYRQVQASDGLETHFPMLVVGHGILGPQTLVFSPRGERRVVIVQSDVYRQCEDSGLAPTPLCADTGATLAKLARRVLARVAR